MEEGMEEGEREQYIWIPSELMNYSKYANVILMIKKL